MKKFLCVILALCSVITAANAAVFAVHAESYAEEHMRVVENYSDIPREVTVQYLVGDDGTPEEASATLAEIRKLAEEVSARYDNDYDKAKAISGWVADHTYYDRNARDNGVGFETIALKNVIQTHRTVCSGYANLTAAMLAAIGLKSVTVIGNTSIDDSNPTGNHHEWTAFWYEKENRWVLMDSGWDSYNYYDGEYVKRDAPRTYFDMKADEFPSSRRAVKAEFRDWFGADGGASASVSGNEQAAVSRNGEDTGNRNNAQDLRDNQDAEEDSGFKFVAIFAALSVILVVSGFIIGFVLKRRRK